MSTYNKVAWGGHDGGDVMREEVEQHSGEWVAGPYARDWIGHRVSLQNNSGKRRGRDGIKGNVH